MQQMYTLNIQHLLFPGFTNPTLCDGQWQCEGTLDQVKAQMRIKLNNSIFVPKKATWPLSWFASSSCSSLAKVSRSSLTSTRPSFASIPKTRLAIPQPQLRFWSRFPICSWQSTPRPTLSSTCLEVRTLEASFGRYSSLANWREKVVGKHKWPTLWIWFPKYQGKNKLNCNGNSHQEKRL